MVCRHTRVAHTRPRERARVPLSPGALATGKATVTSAPVSAFRGRLDVHTQVVRPT